MRHTFLLFIAAAVSLEVLADILFKYWSGNTKIVFLYAGLCIYTIGTIIWAFSLKQEGLSKAITIFTIINLIGGILAGVLLFNETLSFSNKIGILLGIVSVVLLQL